MTTAPKSIKENLKESLIALMNEMPSDKIKIVDLSIRANVARSSIYRYYSSIDELFRDIEDEFLDGFWTQCSTCISADLSPDRLPSSVFISIGNYLIENKDVFLAMTNQGANPRFVHKWNKMGRKFLSEKYAHDLRKVENEDMLIAFSTAGMTNTLRNWLKYHEEISSEQLSYILQNIIFGSLDRIIKIQNRFKLRY